jgi:CheY-like chemotaxis protein
MKPIKPLLIVVDDDADDRMLCEEYFGQENDRQELLLLSSAEELFIFLDTLPHADPFPALVLLDYNMPKMTGGEVLLRLRRQARYASLKVALYSSGMSTELEKCLKNLDAVHCFNKPVSVDEFLHMNRTIQSIIDPKPVYAA